MKKLLVGVTAIVVGVMCATATAECGRVWEDLSWWGKSGATPAVYKDSEPSGLQRHCAFGMLVVAHNAGNSRRGREKRRALRPARRRQRQRPLGQPRRCLQHVSRARGRTPPAAAAARGQSLARNTYLQ